MHSLPAGPEKYKKSSSCRENMYSGDRLLGVQITALTKVTCGM
jgi:hypothetical protein